MSPSAAVAEGCFSRGLFTEYLVIRGKKLTFFSQCKKICSLEFVSLENSSKQLNILWQPVVANGHFLCQHGCQKVPLRKIYLVKRTDFWICYLFIYFITQGCGIYFLHLCLFLSSAFSPSECSLVYCN